MMSNLFSMFDPQSSYMLINNWISLMIMPLMLFSKYWLISNKMNIMWNNVINFMIKEMKISMITYNNKINSIMLMSLFTMLAIMNVISLFPYIFNPTSHMSLTMSLSIPMWMSIMLFGWMNFYTSMFSHLVPESTPKVLMPFMVFIESISNMIRPMTLAIRLAANMIAGHLLICLLGNQFNQNSLFIIPSLVVIQLLLMTLEISVSIIQSYVFTVLMTLYMSDI